MDEPFFIDNPEKLPKQAKIATSQNESKNQQAEKQVTFDRGEKVDKLMEESRKNKLDKDQAKVGQGDSHANRQLSQDQKLGIVQNVHHP